MNRTMILGHEAIIRDVPVDPKHNEYPKHMAHPAFQPGKVGPEAIVGGFAKGIPYNLPGTAIRFPPVLVMNADQEEYHRSQGYVTQGKSDPDAFVRAVATASIPAPAERIEYPKWVGGVLCKSADEEAAAAEKRRAQLGIKPDESELSASADPADGDSGDESPVEKTPDQLRVEQLETEMAEMREKMQRMLAAQATEPVVKATETAPEPMTRGQKIAAGKARKAAERAAQKAA